MAWARIQFVLFLCAWTAASTALAAAAEQTESERLNAFFDRVYKEAVQRWPEWQTSLGLKDNYDKWNDRSEERRITEHEIAIRNLVGLRAKFDFNRLDEAAKLSYRIFERNVEQDILRFPYRHHYYPISHLSGAHKRIPAFLINRHDISTRQDAEDYITRLDGIANVLAQVIRRLKIHADKGIIPPRFVFPMVQADIAKILEGAPFENAATDSTLLADFRMKVEALEIPEADRAEFIEAAERSLLGSVGPAYEDLARYLADLEGQATTDDGVWKFPDGDAYYEQTLKRATTTDLSAQEIHDYGLADVARIHDEMRKLMTATGFDGSLLEFFEFMRSDSSNFYANTDAGRSRYLAQVEKVIAAVRRRIGAYFATTPKAQLTVKRVESFREKTSPQGFYNSPARYGDRPGAYYVNLYDMTQMPKSQLEGLAYHEAIPGHHLQIAIAQELDGLPEFRRSGGYTAYVEGWALYAESLGKEMGFYENPYSDFGRLSWELLRAARLVVDTGIHFKHWTREEAIAYLDQNLPETHEANTAAIERYIVWPAQATAYKIGMREILRLRERAKERLSERFDIRAFHQVVLGNGALPLDVLADLVERWINDQGS